MLNFILGTELNDIQKKHVLAAYVHRFTAEHTPQWALQPRPTGGAYQPQHASDQDWLASTRFAVNKDGSLNQKIRHCESTTSWPETAPAH